VLRRRFSPARPLRSAEQRTYYDTFDWRLHSRGMTLFSRSADDQMLLGLDGRGARLRAPVEKIPCFADELETGPLRDALAGIVENRRLHAIACLDERSECVDVEDDEGKTIARVYLEHNTATDPASPQRSKRLPLVVRVRALRGYRTAFRAVCDALAAVPGLRRSTGGRLDAALARLDRKPRDYSAKRCAWLSRRSSASCGPTRMGFAAISIQSICTISGSPCDARAISSAPRATSWRAMPMTPCVRVLPGSAR
jgi:hypothetical protein